MHQAVLIVPCGGRVKEQVINFDNYIGKSVGDSLHEPLEASGGAEEPNGGGDPLKLSLPRNHEGSVWSDLGWSSSCQKLAVRSMVMKMVLPDWQISPMLSPMSFMEYLSIWV